MAMKKHTTVRLSDEHLAAMATLQDRLSTPVMKPTQASIIRHMLVYGLDNQKEVFGLESVSDNG